MTVYLLTEASALLGVDRKTLFNWLRAGRQIPGAVTDTAGNVIGFECSAFDAYKEEISK